MTVYRVDFQRIEYIEAQSEVDALEKFNERLGEIYQASLDDIEVTDMTSA